MKSRCILAGIDLGADTEKIVSYAACFSAGTKSSVRLLYVLDYLLTPPTYLMPYIKEEQKRDDGELQRWKAVLEKQGISSDSRVMMGRLHESFVKAIEEFSPDLLIIGYQSHAFRPSSSERLIKSLEMPMLVVRGSREDIAGSPAVRKVLCAVDFSDNAQKALVRASDYAQAFSADLHVVHSIPSHTIKSRWAVWEAIGDADKDQFDMQTQAEAEAELSRMIQKSGVQHLGEVLHWNPAETICSFAEEGGYDLIVMGARGLSYIQGVLIGSTSESVLRSSPCPVLIVGLTVTIAALRGKRNFELKVEAHSIRRDLTFFLLMYSIAIILPVIGGKTILIPISFALVAGYVFHAYLTFRSESAEIEHSESMYLWRIIQRLKPLLLRPKPPLFVILAQIALALAVMIKGAHTFLQSLEVISAKFGMDPLIFALLLAPVATELPEKFNSVTWTWKGRDTLALGNITGAMVFQSTFPVSVGLIYTDWNITGMALFSAVLAIVSTAAVLGVITVTKRISPFVMLFGGLLYIIYAAVLIFR